MVSAIEKQVLQSQVLDRIQQVQQQHPDMQQQYFNIQLSEERRKMKKKVPASDEIYHAKIDGDDWKGKDRDHAREQTITEQGRAEQASTESNPTDHIDIKV